MSVTVTPIGFVVIPLGLLLFLRSRRQLFWATVISIPFFYTYILNLPFTHVQPAQYFGMLLILGNLLETPLQQGQRRYAISPTTAVVLLFLVVSYVSLIMPAVHQDSVYVLPPETGYQDFENVEPLRFRIHNLSQIAYPTFMVFLFLSLVRGIRDLATVKNVVRASVASAFVVIGFGLFHQIGVVSGLNEWVERAFYFVTGLDRIGPIYSTYNMIGNLPRMVSLTGEPGYTGSYLLFVTAIVFGLTFNAFGSGWRINRGKLLGIVMLFGLFMTGSTTGYLGLFLMIAFLVVFPKLFRLGTRGHRLRSTLLFTTFFALIVGALILSAPIILETSFFDYLHDTHYAKMFEQEGSGAIRTMTIVSGVKIFLHSPILGVGYGSHRTASLLTSLLSNVGIVGTVAFLWLNVLVFRRGLRLCRRSDNPELLSITYALLVCLASLVPVMLVGKSLIALVHGWYWLLLAMLEGCYRIYLRETGRAEEQVPIADGVPAAAR